MTDPSNKIQKTPDGAIVNDDGGFVLPDSFTADNLIQLQKKIASQYKSIISMKEWLVDRLTGVPFINLEK